MHVQYFSAKYLIVTEITLFQIISDQVGWTEQSEQFKATRTFLTILAATKDLKKENSVYLQRIIIKCMLQF